MPKEIQAAIEEMTRRIVDGFHPEKIILFGSVARGESGPDSDIDLLVVMPVIGSKREVRLKLRLAVNDIGVAHDIVIATPEELRDQTAQVGTTAWVAAQDGRVIYDRAA